MVSFIFIFGFVVGIGLLCWPLLTRLSARLDHITNSLALYFFGSYVSERTEKQVRQVNLIRSARMDVMHRTYASRTLLYAVLAGVSGAILGVYVIFFTLHLLAIPTDVFRQILPQQLQFLTATLPRPDFSPIERFIVFILGSLFFGSVSGAGSYSYRWWRPRYKGSLRETRIDESLPRTVAFMFALSRSGMSHEETVKILTENSIYFGEAANEFAASYRDIKFSEADFLTATKRLARSSPSTEFTNFAEDLATILQTGRPMSEYLQEEYNRYQEEKERRQNQILEEIAALAEGYVALLVAGPLFLIVTLVIIGLLTGGTLPILQASVYLIFPLVTVGFVLYLDNITRQLGIDVDIDTSDLSAVGEAQNQEKQTETDRQQVSSGSTSTAATDGGTNTRITGGSTGNARNSDNHTKLDIYESLSEILDQVKAPVQTVITKPVKTLYVTVPIGILYFLIWLYLSIRTGEIGVRVVDDYLVQGTLFILCIFAIAQYFHDKKMGQIETALPDFIDRIADSGSAGMTLAQAIEDMEPESIPGLEQELRELSRDIQLGGRTSEALKRFAERTKSVLVIRSVVLIINASHAKSDITPVLRIAADEAQLDRQLKRQRRQELLIYRIIIYMSFFIFIGITAALVLLFIPSIPSGLSTPGAGPGGDTGAIPAPSVGEIGIGGGAEVNRGAYVLILYHAAMIQAILAGLVAGKMSEGDIQAGVKHSAVMLATGYLAVLLLS